MDLKQLAETAALALAEIQRGVVDPQHTAALTALITAVLELEGNGLHLVKVTETGYVIQHPLSCRPNLFGCPVQVAAGVLDGPPVTPGVYEAEVGDQALLTLARRVS